LILNNTKVDEVGIPLSFYNNVKVQKDGNCILNMLPSLQKMFCMAFGIRVMHDLCTIRIDPFVSLAFIAGFNRDEMNILCIFLFI